MIRYDHWKQVPRTISAWPWRYFQPQEMACRGTGKLAIQSGLLDSLDILRSLLGSPLAVLSAYRSSYHNARVGGAPLSRHLFGDAVDLSIVGKDKELIKRLAVENGFNGIGHYHTFVHIDRRPNIARWGEERWND